MTTKNVLLLRLEGPMQGYGTSQAHEVVRDTATVPSKSAVLGIVCACLGKDRNTEDDFLAELCRLRMGVRVDRAGSIRADLQTAQSPLLARTVKLDKTHGVLIPTSIPKDKNGMCTRYYLFDASFLVGLEGPKALLQQINESLRQPRWAPCLGRRGCVPTEPLFVPNGLKEGSLESVLESYPLGSGKFRFVVETDVGAGNKRVQDVPLSFHPDARRFGLREVRDWTQEVNTNVSQ